MVDLYRLPLDLPPEQITALRATLAPDELARADRYIVAHARRRFIAARGQLRAVLAGYLRCAAEAVRFGVQPGGKPFLLPVPLREAGILPCFNLSHSADLGLLAVGEVELGVDVEAIRRDVEFLSLAKRFFAPAEAAALSALTGEEQVLAFYRVWTRKEALLKHSGQGITGGLNTIVLPVPPDPALQMGKTWLLELPVGDGFAAALAVEGDLPRLAWKDFMV